MEGMTAWIGWIAGPVMGLAVAGLVFWQKLKTIKADARKGDASARGEELTVEIKEKDDIEKRWEKLYDSMTEKLARLETELNNLRTQDVAKSVQLARLETENGYLQRELAAVKMMKVGGVGISECYRAEIIAGLDGVIIDVSDGVMGLVGYRPAELVGKTVEFILPDGQKHTHGQAVKMASAGAGNRPPNMAVKGFAKHKDGSAVAVVVVLDVVPASADGQTPKRFKAQVMNLVV